MLVWSESVSLGKKKKKNLNIPYQLGEKVDETFLVVLLGYMHGAKQ